MTRDTSTTIYFVHIPKSGEPIAQSYMIQGDVHDTLLITFARDSALAFIKEMKGEKV